MSNETNRGVLDQQAKMRELDKQRQQANAGAPTLSAAEAENAVLRRENLALAQQVEELQGQLKLRRELDDKSKVERDKTPYAITKIQAGKDGTFEPGDPIPEHYCATIVEGEDFVRGPMHAARALGKRASAVALTGLAPAPPDAAP